MKYRMTAFFNLAVILAMGAEASEVLDAKAILAKAGLTEGAYSLVEKESAEECFTGELRIRGDTGNFTLMMGAHPIAGSLGRETAATYSERGCEYEEKAGVSERKIEWTKTADCRKSKDIKSVLYFQTVIEPMKEGGFNYRSTVREKKEGKKELTTVRNCVYRPGAEE